MTKADVLEVFRQLLPLFAAGGTTGWVLPLHQCMKHPQHIHGDRSVPTLSEPCASKVGTTELLLQHPAAPPSSQGMGANPSDLGTAHRLHRFLLKNLLQENLHGIQGSGLTLVFNYPNISSLPLSVFHISFQYLGVQAPLTLAGTMQSSLVRK